MKKILLLLLFVFGVITVSGCSLEPGEGLPTWYTYCWQGDYKKEKIPFDTTQVISAGTLHNLEGYEKLKYSKGIFDSLAYGASVEGYKYSKDRKLELPDYTNHFKGIDKFGVRFRDNDQFNKPLSHPDNGLKRVKFDLWLTFDWGEFQFNRYKGKLLDGQPFLNWTVYLRKYYQISTSNVTQLVVFKQNFTIDLDKLQNAGDKAGYFTTINISTGNDGRIVPKESTDVRKTLFDLVIEIRPFEYTEPYDEEDFRNNDNKEIPIPGATSEENIILNKKTWSNPYLAIKNFDKQITNLRFYWR